MNDLTSTLGIALPIVQAPMAGVQDAALAIAVSRAGGLGSLPAAMLTLQQLEQQLARLQSTGLAFNVNFFAHTQPTSDSAEQEAWQGTLAPYYAEWGIDAKTVSAGAGRSPFGEEACVLVERFRPRVISFHFGLPPQNLLQRVKAVGAQIWSTATTLQEGLWLQQQGADVVIAQGLEAGGHRGHFLSDDLTEQMGTMALVPQLVASLDLPVVAAGGITSPQSVKAAITLGASAVLVGTAYLLSDEATTSAVHRAALRSPQAAHTQLTTLFSGRPARGIRNRLMSELGPMPSTVPRFPMATGAIAPLRAAAEARGKGDFSPLWCGQNTEGLFPANAGTLTTKLASLL